MNKIIHKIIHKINKVIDIYNEYKNLMNINLYIENRIWIKIKIIIMIVYKNLTSI